MHSDGPAGPHAERRRRSLRPVSALPKLVTGCHSPQKRGAPRGPGPAPAHATPHRPAAGCSQHPEDPGWVSYPQHRLQTPPPPPPQHPRGSVVLRGSRHPRNAALVSPLAADPRQPLACLLLPLPTPKGRSVSPGKATTG